MAAHDDFNLVHLFGELSMVWGSAFTRAAVCGVAGENFAASRHDVAGQRLDDDDVGGVDRAADVEVEEERGRIDGRAAAGLHQHDVSGVDGPARVHVAVEV